MDEDRHKDTEGQRDSAEGYFCFVPVCLCTFVPSYSLKTNLKLSPKGEGFSPISR